MEMFADRLKMLRKDNSFTMKEAAQLIGVSYATYNKWEHGGVFPRPEMIRAIANAYEVKLKWLEIGQGPKTYKEEEKQERSDHLGNKTASRKGNALLFKIQSRSKHQDLKM